jgi:hypothetical protein
MNDDSTLSADARPMMASAWADAFVDIIPGIFTHGAERRN